MSTEKKEQTGKVDPFDMSRDDLDTMMSETPAAFDLFAEAEAQAQPNSAADSATPGQQLSAPSSAEEVEKLQQELEQEKRRRSGLDRKLQEQNDHYEKVQQQLTAMMQAFGIGDDPGSEEDGFSSQFSELLATDPDKAYELLAQRREVRMAEAQKQHLEQLEQQRKGVKSFVEEKYSNFNDHMDDYLEMLKADGVSDKVIETFKENPYDFPIDSLVHLLKRAELRRENAQLKQTTEELKARLSGMPKKLANATRTRPVLTSNASSAMPDKPVDFFSMSQDELAAWRKQNHDKSPFYDHNP